MKLLYVTSLSGKRVNGFMRSAIVAARGLGLEFVMACNTDMADKDLYAQDCEAFGIRVEHVDFARNPLSAGNRKAYRQLLGLMEREHFDAVHCNTPVGGLLGRVCARKAGVPKVIYMAHGLHFWKGAPLKNWLMYYPVERWLSGCTDDLITIAREDYDAAQRMRAKRVSFVHGVGVNLEQFSRREAGERNMPLRDRMGIPRGARVLLSVGELNGNKNHIAVMNALAKARREDIHYVICGEGELRKQYEDFLSEQGMKDRVHLAGFQSGIAEYYRMADLFVFPSLREGVPGAIMEAIATGVPVIASDIRGIRDIVTDGRYRFDPASSDSIAEKILWALESDHAENLETNYRNIAPYSFSNVVKELTGEYRLCLGLKQGE